MCDTGECNRMLKDRLDFGHVKAAWAGLRPLVRDPNADPSDTKALSRDHVIDVRAGGEGVGRGGGQGEGWWRELWSGE